MRERAILIWFAFIAVFVMIGCSKNETPQKSEVRIAAMRYPIFAPILLAHDLGFLKEEFDNIGVSYTWTEFKSGPLVNEAVAAGTIDIGFMADMPAIIAKSSGQDIQIFANIANGEKALGVIVKNDSPIDKIEDLKGKKIAYVKGSYAQHLLALVLEKTGFTFGDITSVNLGVGDIPSALESEDIDAAVVWEQYVTLLTSQDKAKVIADGTGIKRGNLVSYVVRKYADKRPEVIAAYIRAAHKASLYIKSNPKEAAKVLEKGTKIEARLLEKIFEKLEFYQAFRDEDILEIKRVKDYILSERIISQDVDIEEFVTTKYIKEAGI